MLAVFLFSSLALAKSIPINKPITASVEVTLISPSGECVSILGQGAVNDLLAQDWVKDSSNLCVSAALESPEGNCVETVSTVETQLFLNQGYALLDRETCN